MLTDTSKSTYAKLRSLSCSDIRWKEGFWNGKLMRCKETIVPNMYRLISDPVITHIYENFKIAAGRKDGDHKNPPFNDGDLYKWLEGACYLLGMFKDSQLEQLVDHITELISEVQREDGYIFTKQAISALKNPGKAKPLTDDLNFEVYNMGHLMTAACIHFRATGKKSLLEIAERAAKYLEQTFGELDAKKAKTAICPSHYMGIIELYRTTGKLKYLKLAETLIALRDLVEFGNDDNQDRIPLREQREAVGHAVRANYLYAGVADLYAEIGDETLLPVLHSVWKDVVEKKIYITGGCGALYDGVSPYGCNDYNYIQRVHQAYGRAYELPNLTAYNETCAQIGNVFWNWRMHNLFPDARYAEMIEHTLFNSIISGISIDGTKFFYENMLRRFREIPFSLKWSRKRERFISSFCCPPNMVRTIAETASYAYAYNDNNIYPVLYGSNTAHFTLPHAALELTQKTEYPWNGSIEFVVTDASGDPNVTLHLRIPSWSLHSQLWVNGESIELSEETRTTYIPLKRTWKKGDTVLLLLDMTPRFFEAHPMVEELRNQVSVQRGPLIYCLESIDLPEEYDITDIFIPRDGSFSASEKKTAIDGEEVVLLTGRGLHRNKAPSRQCELLYRPYQDLLFESFELVLVPYYAWDNRGFGEMTVWLPLA